MPKKVKVPNNTPPPDITDHKQAEEELKLRAQILDGATDSIFLHDFDGNFIYVNETACRTHGYSREEFMKMKLHQVIAPERVSRLDSDFQEMLEKGQVIFESAHLRKDGSIMPAEVHGRTIGSGGRKLLLTVIRDITERKRVEKEIQDKNEQLEAQNEELQAAEEELRASNEELREIHEQLIRSERLAAIGQLAGGVGHELRNPLGAIKNAVYYIKGKVAKSELGQKEPRVVEFLDIMDDEINASNKIINDLLGFSRVGKPSVSPTRIDKVIEDALSRTPIPENIELTKKLDADLPEVNLDPDQIQQVWVNMILNAVQAMPEGGKLTIAASEKNEFLEIKIADTGCGIPQEAMDKIFDPLFTTKAKGIGLGLAVCKAIINRHQGNIEVESKVGKGTTFIIKLSLKTESSEREDYIGKE